MDKPQRAAMYAEYLKEAGYSPSFDQDGDIRFMYEGKTLFVLVAKDDEVFFRMIMPNFWPIDSDGERAAIEHAAAIATARTKVAKIFPIEKNVWGSVELFLSPPEAFRPVFARCLNALTTAVQTFVNEMRQWQSRSQ